jgi:hypothetical protein
MRRIEKNKIIIIKVDFRDVGEEKDFGDWNYFRFLFWFYFEPMYVNFSWINEDNNDSIVFWSNCVYM